VYGCQQVQHEGAATGLHTAALRWTARGAVRAGGGPSKRAARYACDVYGSGVAGMAVAPRSSSCHARPGLETMRLADYSIAVVSVVVSFSSVQRRSPVCADRRPCRWGTVPTHGEPRDADLESVLGATPHEFESRILRQPEQAKHRPGPLTGAGPTSLPRRAPRTSISPPPALR